MFALRDGDGKLKKTWRPEPLQVTVLEGAVEAKGFTVRFTDPAASDSAHRLSESTIERYKEMVEALENAEQSLL